MKKVIGFLGVAIIITVFIVGFVAYFVFSFDPSMGVTFDGLGRRLSESPWFMRLLFGEERLWAGWKWFILDMVIFWGSIGIGGALVSWGFKSEN